MPDLQGDHTMAAPPADPNEVDRLIHAALWDTGGESVEGAFVDHWVSNASRAVENLHELFSAGGFSRADAERIRQAMREGPTEAVVLLLHGLDRWTRPIVTEMLQSPAPRARASAVHAGARLLDPPFVLPFLTDPDPEVRLAAVRTLFECRSHLPGWETHLAGALEDPDAGVRREAGLHLTRTSHPEAEPAWLRFIESERDTGVRGPIISALATGTTYDYAAGYRGKALVERIGEARKQLLLRELNNEDAGVREGVTAALACLPGADVAAPLLDRLLIEESPDVRRALLRFREYSDIAGRALPAIRSLVGADPDPAVRVAAALSLENFRDGSAVPVLAAALDDPFLLLRRAAANTLGELRDRRALLALMRALADPASQDVRPEIVGALRSITAWDTYREPQAPSPEAAAALQRRIDALDPQAPGDWPTRVCKQELNALPLRAGSALYLWAIRPDGVVLRLDLDALRDASQPETDPLLRFAVVLHGARRYPELQDFIPPPPRNVRPCDACTGTGSTEEAGATVECGRCDGFGWYVAAP